MFLPLSDAPNARRVPWVTYGLIAINVAVFLAINLPLGRQAVRVDDPRLRDYVETLRDAAPPNADLRPALAATTAFDLFVLEYGFRPARPQLGDLFTSMFLHGGLMHLFGNMLFLWIYGDNVEHRLGPVRYLLAYIATGIAATLAFTLLSLGSKLPMIGASGAISGVLGLYFVWFPRNVVRVFLFIFPIFVNVIEIPARIVLGIYLVLDNLVPMFFASDARGGGVAHGAHIGGFVAGLALAWGVNRTAGRGTPAGFRVTSGGDDGDTSADAISSAIARGDMERAARAYFSNGGPKRLAPRALSPADSSELGAWLLDQQRPDAALAVFLRQLRDDPRGPGSADAHIGAGAALLATGQVASAYQYLRQGLDQNPSPAAAARAYAGLATIAQQQKLPLDRFTRRA